MEALSTLKEMSSQCGVSPQQIIRFGGQSACNASATGKAPAQPLPSAPEGGGLRWGGGMSASARGIRTHARAITHR